MNLDRQKKSHTSNFWMKLLCGCLITLTLIVFRQLLEKVCQIANVLKSKGVKKGDLVAIYMPICPLAVAAMLACARIGAVHR